MTINYKELRQLRRSWDNEPDNTQKMGLNPFILAILTLFMLYALYSIAYADNAPTVNVERLANAIYKAEGGNKTKHPYGILAKYKHTTPRQACINTIKSALKRYTKQGAKGDFIVFLGKTYCPVGASNDPWGLNKNWVKNVKHYYEG